MSIHITTMLVLVFVMLSFVIEASNLKNIFREATDSNSLVNEPVGKKWSVLIAGSNYYSNYRHQADVCHAYQILKKGGFNDENIIVFMYDDIAFNSQNPRPGIIINKPYGKNVYDGVPKDYTGEDVNVANFFAVILGNKTAITGGTGKVVDSGPNDNIFIYYTDHGGAGILGMPDDVLYAKDLIKVLKKKHEAKSYRKMVIYVEACESGSVFEGLLPDNLNIYAVTASDPKESSYGTYCPSDYPDVAPEFDVCLGDLFSISWIEDSELHDMSKERLEEQYRVVKRRTKYEGLTYSHEFQSNVTQYGNKNISSDFLGSYIGVNPNFDIEQNNFATSSSMKISMESVSQYDSDLFYLNHKVRKAPEGSFSKIEAQRELNDEILKRSTVDQHMNLIAKELFGSGNSLNALQNNVRPKGQPLVDDWDCFKSLVKVYEEKCGSLTRYGRKYMRAFANMCNEKINGDQMTLVAARICG